jgi:hypothetical protein
MAYIPKNCRGASAIQAKLDKVIELMDDGRFTNEELDIFGDALDELVTVGTRRHSAEGTEITMNNYMAMRRVNAMNMAMYGEGW